MNSYKPLLTGIGTGAMLLPNYSPELNPIELVFNVMTQRFKSIYHESIFSTNEEVLTMLHEVVDSISPSVIFSCYQKCGHDNFF